MTDVLFAGSGSPLNSAARTYAANWLGQPALALETSALRLVTVPAMGAKIVSLFDKQAEREWLLPPINRRFEPVAYGASFVDQDMSGWDERALLLDLRYQILGDGACCTCHPPNRFTGISTSKSAAARFDRLR